MPDKIIKTDAEWKNILKPATEKIYLGAGCFWCTEAVFRKIKGVTSVNVGYMGGTTQNPTYHDVCTGKTGYAEVAEITYDSNNGTLDKILEIFWHIHDPTTLNRQGADVGTQYRSVIFYTSKKQKNAAIKSMQVEQKRLKNPIVTEIVPADKYYPAEDYHQNYYNNNSNEPYCKMIIAPKLKKIK